MFDNSRFYWRNQGFFVRQSLLSSCWRWTASNFHRQFSFREEQKTNTGLAFHGSILPCSKSNALMRLHCKKQNIQRWIQRISDIGMSSRTLLYRKKRYFSVYLKKTLSGISNGLKVYIKREVLRMLSDTLGFLASLKGLWCKISWRNNIYWEQENAKDISEAWFKLLKPDEVTPIMINRHPGKSKKGRCAFFPKLVIRFSLQLLSW